MAEEPLSIWPAVSPPLSPCAGFEPVVVVDAVEDEVVVVTTGGPGFGFGLGFGTGVGPGCGCGPGSPQLPERWPFSAWTSTS